MQKGSSDNIPKQHAFEPQNPPQQQSKGSFRIELSNNAMPMQTRSNNYLGTQEPQQQQQHIQHRGGNQYSAASIDLRSKYQDSSRHRISKESVSGVGSGIPLRVPHARNRNQKQSKVTFSNNSGKSSLMRPVAGGTNGRQSISIRGTMLIPTTLIAATTERLAHDEEQMESMQYRTKQIVRGLMVDKPAKVIFAKALRHFRDAHLLRTARNIFDRCENGNERPSKWIQLHLFFYELRSKMFWRFLQFFMSYFYLMQTFEEPPTLAQQMDYSAILSQEIMYQECLILAFCACDTFLALCDVRMKKKQFFRNVWVVSKKCFLFIVFFTDFIIFWFYPDILAIRAATILRPLWVISYEPQISKSLQAIFLSFRKVIDIFLFFIAMSAFWGYMAYNLFQDYADSITEDHYFVFNTIGESMLGMYSLISMDSYPNIMKSIVMDNPAYLVFFIPYVGLNLFFLLFVPVAVIFDNYKKQRAILILKDDLIIKEALTYCFYSVSYHNNDDFITKDQFFDLLDAYFHGRGERDKLDLLYETLNVDIQDQLSLNEFLDVVDLMKASERLYDDSYMWWNKFREFCNEYLHFEQIGHSSMWNYMILFVVLINTLMILLSTFLTDDSDTSESTLSDLLSNIDIAFNVIYFLDVFIKVVGFGIHEYFHDTWNNFDFIMVVISLITIIGIKYIYFLKQAKSTKLVKLAKIQKVLKIFRSIRSLKLVKIIKVGADVIFSLQKLFHKVAMCVPSIYGLVKTYFLFTFSYAVIGTYLFNIDYNDYILGSPYENNDYTDFNTVYGALLALFQILTQSHWIDYLYDYGFKFNLGVAMIYFCFYHMFSILFFMSLLQGIVWEVFSVVEEFFKQQEKEEIENYMKHHQNSHSHTDEGSHPSSPHPSDQIGQIDFTAAIQFQQQQQQQVGGGPYLYSKVDEGDNEENAAVNKYNNNNDEEGESPLIQNQRIEKMYLRSKGGKGSPPPRQNKSNQQRLLEMSNEFYSSPNHGVVPIQSERGGHEAGTGTGTAAQVNLPAGGLASEQFSYNFTSEYEPATDPNPFEPPRSILINLSKLSSKQPPHPQQKLGTVTSKGVNTTTTNGSAIAITVISPESSKQSLERIDSVPAAASTTQLITEDEEVRLKSTIMVHRPLIELKKFPISIEEHSSPQTTTTKHLLNHSNAIPEKQSIQPKLLTFQSTEEIIPNESLPNPIVLSGQQSSQHSNSEEFSLVNNNNKNSSNIYTNLINHKSTNPNGQLQQFDYLIPNTNVTGAAATAVNESDAKKSVSPLQLQQLGSYESTGLENFSPSSTFKIINVIPPVPGTTGIAAASNNSTSNGISLDFAFSATKDKVFSVPNWNPKIPDSQKNELTNGIGAFKQTNRDYLELNDEKEEGMGQEGMISPSFNRPSNVLFNQERNNMINIHINKSHESPQICENSPKSQFQQQQQQYTTHNSPHLLGIPSQNLNSSSDCSSSEAGEEVCSNLRIAHNGGIGECASEFEDKMTMKTVEKPSVSVLAAFSLNGFEEDANGQKEPILSAESKTYFLKRVQKLKYQNNLQRELIDLEDFLQLQDSVGLRMTEERRARIVKKHKNLNMFSISKQHALEKMTYLRDNPINKNYSNLKAYIQATEYGLGYAKNPVTTAQNPNFTFTNNRMNSSMQSQSQQPHSSRSESNNNHQQQQQQQQHSHTMQQDSVNESMHQSHSQYTPNQVIAMHKQYSSKTHQIDSVFVKLNNMFSFVLHIMNNVSQLNSEFIAQKLFLVEQSINEIIFGTYNETHAINHFKILFSIRSSHQVLIKIFDKEQQRRKRFAPPPQRRRFSKNMYEIKEKVMQDSIVVKTLASQIGAPWAQFKKAFAAEKTIYFIKNLFESLNNNNQPSGKNGVVDYSSEKELTRHISDQLQFMRGQEFCLADLSKIPTEMYAMFIKSTAASSNNLQRNSIMNALNGSTNLGGGGGVVAAVNNPATAAMISFICTRSSQVKGDSKKGVGVSASGSGSGGAVSRGREPAGDGNHSQQPQQQQQQVGRNSIAIRENNHQQQGAGTLQMPTIQMSSPRLDTPTRIQLQQQHQQQLSSQQQQLQPQQQQQQQQQQDTSNWELPNKAGNKSTVTNLNRDQHHVLEIFHYIQTFFGAHAHLLSGLMRAINPQSVTLIPCYEYF